MWNPHMISSCPLFTRASMAMRRCIQGRGTGHITLGGQSCRSALLRHINPRMLWVGYLSWLPNTQPQLRTMTPHFPDANRCYTVDGRLTCLLGINSSHTPSHSQWVSNVVLHHTWANRTEQFLDPTQEYIPSADRITAPVDLILNCPLVWGIFLGSPAEEEALRVQDKSCDISCFAFWVAYTTVHQLSHATDPTSKLTGSLRPSIQPVLCEITFCVCYVT